MSRQCCGMFYINFTQWFGMSCANSTFRAIWEWYARNILGRYGMNIAKVLEANNVPIWRREAAFIQRKHTLTLLLHPAPILAPLLLYCFYFSVMLENSFVVMVNVVLFMLRIACTGFKCYVSVFIWIMVNYCCMIALCLFYGLIAC